jgi:hypothetical protein
MEPVLISTLPGRAWDTVRKNLTVLVGLQVVFYMAFFLMGILMEAVKGSMPMVFYTVSLLNYAAQIIFGVGMIRIALKITEGEEPKLSDILPTFSQAVRYLIANLFVLVAALLVMFILFSLFNMSNPNFYANDLNRYLFWIFAGVPLLVLSLRFQFSTYFIVQTESPAIAALLKSYIITKGYLGKLVLLILLIIAINILGLLALGVGLLISIPVSILMITYMYRDLNAHGIWRDEPGAGDSD